MPDLVLVTGISGFIAKHVALELLRDGYAVRGTVRNAERGAEVRAALSAAGADIDHLEIVEADLTSDTGWAEAAAGCRYVQHVASPLPVKQPRHREALVPAAREGALRVLEAARRADANRIVMTSSIAAMMYRANRPARFVFSEHDWTDPEWKTLTAYFVSKTRAEKAAWQWAEEHGWHDRFTVVNPGVVLGPALDARAGASLTLIKMLLEGAYPALPRVSLPIVDVREVAAVHLKAMDLSDTPSRRLISTGETLSIRDMSLALKAAFPQEARRAPTRLLPDWVVMLGTLFDRSLTSIRPDLGVVPIADSGYVTELTGVRNRPAAEAVEAAAESLIRLGVV